MADTTEKPVTPDVLIITQQMTESRMINDALQSHANNVHHIPLFLLVRLLH